MKFKPLTQFDYAVVITLCIIIGSVALYDISQLNQIEKKCLDDCNKHWINEFRKQCRNEYWDKEMIYTLKYITNITQQIEND